MRPPTRGILKKLLNPIIHTKENLPCLPRLPPSHPVPGVLSILGSAGISRNNKGPSLHWERGRNELTSMWQDQISRGWPV
jgi:hypothetical protein